MDKLVLDEAVGASVERAPKWINDTINQMVGTYKVEHWRDGKLLQTLEGKNTIVNAGKNMLLNIMFNNTSLITPWYIGIIDNASLGAGPAVGDTMGSHAGWIELIAYSESFHQTWVVGSASGQSITNATAATFTINATKTAYGIFITSNNAKSATTGTLWAATGFSSTISLNGGDLLKVTYTVSC